MERCAYCEEERDELYQCEECGDPTCEDCTAAYDQHTQYDFTLCKSCETNREKERADDAEREEQRQNAADKKRESRREAARKRYWLPENVEKRAVEKRERIANERRALESALKETAETIRDWFR